MLQRRGILPTHSMPNRARHHRYKMTPPENTMPGAFYFAPNHGEGVQQFFDGAPASRRLHTPIVVGAVTHTRRQ